MSKHYPPEILEAVRLHYPTTPSPRKLAESLGITYGSLRNIAVIVQVQRRVNEKLRRPHTSPREKILIERYPTCASVPELAKELGLTINTLYACARQLGLKRKQHSPRRNAKANLQTLEIVRKEYEDCRDRRGLAKRLGITHWHLLTLAQQLGLKAKNRSAYDRGNRAEVFTEAQDEIIRANFQTLNLKSLSKLIRKAPCNVTKRIKVLGLVKVRPKKEPKPKEPRKMYPSDYKKLSEAEKKRKAEERCKERQEKKALELKIRQAAATAKAQKKKAPPALPTLNRDFSKMRTVRVDARTYIQIPADADPVKAIEQYRKLKAA